MTKETAQQKGILRLMNMNELSNAIGITKSGIFGMIKAGKFPQGMKLGGSRRWDIDDVNNWLKSQNQGLKKSVIQHVK